MGKGEKDLNLKFGLALVFSIGGMLFVFIRNKTIKPSKSRSGSSKSSDCSNEGISLRGSKSEHLYASSKTSDSCVFDPLASDKNALYFKRDYVIWNMDVACLQIYM
ncbi:hypothetical protein CTI12_AA605230 [Artemisia annua]|uniref:Uncharacterized protein n=1 Tax=Artemisia annua TaxID=35608 RepID=A0A2U1KDK7_ARTAN|nr:hypothetical protein CTI12_AA605230 [Artemisia annua]